MEIQNSESKEIERLNLLIKKIKNCLEAKKNSCRIGMVNNPIQKHSIDINQWEFNFCDEMIAWIERQENDK
jgi:hypothetical protein